MLRCQVAGLGEGADYDQRRPVWMNVIQCGLRIIVRHENSSASVGLAVVIDRAVHDVLHDHADGYVAVGHLLHIARAVAVLVAARLNDAAFVGSLHATGVVVRHVDIEELRQRPGLHHAVEILVELQGAPPADHLYPQLDDLLDDWRASYRPAFEGIRVLGTRWSPRSYELRDFLARNHVPYQWLDVEHSASDPETKHLLEALGSEAANLPVVLFPDGSKLLEGVPAEIAQKVGLRTRAQTSFYDLAIIGGGPAGLAAAVYGASEGLHTVMIEREAPGGQAGMSSRIENYLGFPTGLSGGDLARRAVVQAQRFGVEILSPQEAVSVGTEGSYRIVRLADGSEISCHALLIATGVQWRRLEAPGIDKLQGAGVYYGGGATEAISCKGEIVYVVGGANSAGQAAMHFAKYAEKVVLLVRSDGLASTMSQYLIDQIQDTPNIQIWTHASVAEAHGVTRLEEISVLCSDTNKVERVSASAMFIFIGALPGTEWLGAVVERDDLGFLLTGPDLMRDGQRPNGWTLDRDPFLLETNVPGLFAVGDVRHGSVKRVASGVGEGSVAVQFIHQYLSKV